MPGHANSPYWTAVDFDSEGDEEPSANPSRRVYLDPWDSEPYSFKTETGDPSLGENLTSMAGEPVSASFYYIPTKYDSDDDTAPASVANGEEIAAAAAATAVYQQRRRSRQHHHRESQPDMYSYGNEVVPILPDRRRSIYNADDYYSHQSTAYESLYHPLPPPPGMHVPPLAAGPRKRVSLPAPPHAHPDYTPPQTRNGYHRRPSRYAEWCDRYAYETLMSEYGALGPAALGPEEWARRALPKAAPGNFHLSRYGHLKIDYSCSWSSLDRHIRNQ